MVELLHAADARPTDSLPSLPEQVADVVGRYPDLPAITVGRETSTYIELWSLADGVAGHLRRSSGTGLIALWAAKSLGMYAAYLGILRAGCAVVPIHPNTPRERARQILHEAGIKMVVCGSASAPPAVRALIEATGTRLVELVHPARRPRHRPEIGPDDRAYVIFTSGSTGRPKGVPVTHGNVLAYLRHVTGRYEVGPGCRLAQGAELTFDSSVFDLLAAWTTGAHVVVPEGRQWLTPTRFLRDHDVTHLLTVPSTITLAGRSRSLEPNCMPELRYSLFGGETLRGRGIAAWQAAAPGSVVENVYGPSELTVTCTNQRVRSRSWEPGETVPIGVPYPHMEVLVVDEHGKSATEGELCVRGPQRFGGYLDPADNRSRFLRSSGTGVDVVSDEDITTTDWYRTGDRVRLSGDRLVHLGRFDRQVKIRGYRIELEEIEQVMCEHRGVREAAVVVDEAQLAAFYTGDGVDVMEFRAFLRRKLPTYMVPVVVRPLPVFPLTSSGKVDLAALRTVLAGR